MADIHDSNPSTTARIDNTSIGSRVPAAAIVSSLKIGATPQSAVDISGTGGANLIGFLQSGAGAVSRTVQSKLRDSLSVKDFGAVGDGVTDDTAAVQAGVNAAYASAKTLFFPTGTYLVNSTITNRGASMCGEGTFYSMIQAGPSFSGSNPIILVQPSAGAYIEYLEISTLSIQPTYSGTKRGSNCILMDFPTATNLAQLNVSRVFCFSSNDYSLQINNSSAANPQGVPSNSTIEQCVFSEGTKWSNVGDSVMFRNNIVRSTSPRNGLYVYQVDVAGVASHFSAVDNNFVCAGGAVYVVRGRSFKFMRNNVELSSGSGTTNGAVIDIDGSAGTIPWTSITDNHIGIFGTATATSAIRVNGSTGCLIGQNTILSGITTTNGILITSNASDTSLGTNEIQSNFTNAVSDSGVGTRGIAKSVTPLNSFTNTGGYQALQVYKGLDGSITVQGSLTCPVNPNGVVFATLPSGFRPLALQRTCLAAVVGGTVTPQAMEIGSSGNMVFYGSNATTSIQFCVTFSTQNYIVGGV